MLIQITRTYFVILFILLVPNQIQFGQTINFNQITVENGLSNNDVNTLLQDKYGFIWFGTDDGLNRYDGYNFKVFRHAPEDTNSISDNSIWALAEDKKGNLWIGTKAGYLNKYDPFSESFKYWKLESDFTEENSVKAIFEDKKGNIWIGTYKDGLYKLYEATNRFDHWSASNDNLKSLSHNYIQSISEDSEGNLLIGTYIGLNIFNPDSPERGFKRFYHNPDNDSTISNNLIWALSQSKNDSSKIWIGTANHISVYKTESPTFKRLDIANPTNLQYGTSGSTVIEEFNEDGNYIWVASYSGLLKLNIQTGKTSRFLHDENNLQSLISNQINGIIKDRTGVLWIATENGISYTTPKSKMFNSIIIDKVTVNTPAELQRKNITAISAYNKDNIIVGTTEGLYSIDYLNYDAKLNAIHEFNDTHIWSIASTNRKDIWVGTFGKGLKKYNFEKNKVTSWDLDYPKARTQSIYYIKTILSDSKNYVWVGYWGVGASRINIKTGDSDIWLYEKGNPKCISHNDVWVIKEDRFGRIWLGTVGGGLNLFEDRDGGIFQHWLKNEAEDKNLSSNNIYSICESKNTSYSDISETILWLGTSNGLNKCTIRNKSNLDIYDIDINIEAFTVKDGLPDNSVNSILEDTDGNLWLGTGSGISFFNVEKSTFTNFSSADGIHGTLMNYESALMLENGLALFGSTKGLNIFDPKKIKQSDVKPNIVFTDFQIFNKSVKIGKDSPLKASILNAKEIVLAHHQNVFSIEFAALDYNSSKSIQYAYKMEGFDTEWIKSGNRRFVTYTNLNAGEYIFKVKATNADGIWNEDFKSLKIIMGQPWWKSFWAYLLYIIFIIIGLLGIRRFEQNRTKLRTELKFREVEADKISELENLKSRFFANLSHEFRTPLMLIKGPLEQLKLNGKNEKKYAENIELIERNSNHLKVLIDQLLELSQLEKAVIPIRAKRTNIVPILKGLFSSFNSIAEEKNIKLLFESNTDSIISWIDIDKLEKIINNLLSNAIKFTESNGLIKIIIEEEDNNGKPFAKIKISDNGISIPEEKLDRIFDRFYQVDDSTQRSFGGSGIGLALVKEFVDLHNWEISVKSEKDKGTEFTLNIPLWDDYLDEGQKLTSEVLTNVDKLINGKIKDSDNGVLLSNNSEHAQNITMNNKTSILIVDDSDDVRKYLSNLLENDYSIFEAEDGLAGIESAKEIMPDLIISDVMMPSMDGFEFCRIIKSEWQTSDIPVILLTAKATFENKIEGLEIGADDYLTKPFESVELFARIKNLLEQRKRLEEKYSSNLDFRIKSNKISTADDDFIKKTIELVENNLDKTNFGTDELARELFVSRTKLHRKMLEITGQAPGEFVRIIKLKHAAKLITEKRLSITQIAYEIGFSSPAQFTRAFRKQFNCLPSEYLSNQK